MKIDKQGFRFLIDQERASQLRIWGEQHHSDDKWISILLEELGEAAKANNEKNDPELIMEIVQVAAVIETWVTSRDWRLS